MARPKNPNHKYMMKLHRQKQYCYVITDNPEITKDGKHRTNISIWGKLSEDNVFIPNTRFKLLSQNEKEKYIFPEGWDVKDALIPREQTARWLIKRKNRRGEKSETPKSEEVKS